MNDLDGIADINRVQFQIPELNVIDTLSPSLDVGIFKRRFSIDDFPVNTIQTLIGREFILNVTDDESVTINSEKQFLTRVIEKTPVLIEPVSFQTIVTDSIQFIWEKVREPFWFEHSIEIFQINQSLLLKIDEIKTIANSETFLSIKNLLPTGDYIWVLKISDEFGNTSISSSIKGRFHVN